EEPSLVILDIMLPDMDGFTVCKKIRKKSNVPIIMLTARGEVTDRVVGLELGADDYLPKPFEPRELVARIQTVLRRNRRVDQALQFKNLEINPVKQTVSLKGNALDLTTLEYQLLLLLAGSPGKTFTRDEILNHLKGVEADVFSRAVDISVSRLRSKLDDNSRQPRFIKTVWGRGYIFLGERL
ncbi:MAG: winged helix-turn-helix domain-containing protein, partial [Nitrospinota bacterium]